MMQSNTARHIPGSRSVRSLFQLRFPGTALAAGFTAAALFAAALAAPAQNATPAASPDQSTAPAPATQPAAATAPKNSISLSSQKAAKTRKQKEDKVVESKDTKKADKSTVKTSSLAGVDSKLPDKALYDKAEDAIKHGRFDVGRLDLQTLLNTYPDSEFMMRAKLAVADSWYKEGGSAALTQAEQEYRDFITFFPNAPEAAEAQMRIGDIYFREMDKPDRDYTPTLHAEQEYRLMLQQFPDSPLVPQARQRLREVQEALAAREANIASFYATHQNWAATIARYQTVADTYPLYSHMEDVLIGLGDSYEAEAKSIRAQPACSAETQAKHLPCMPESAKSRLMRIYDDQAANAYRKVVLEHSAAPHVEDAKDRLVGMNLTIPTPTPEQAAASLSLENSRGQYTLSTRATLMFLNKADTVQASTIGAPLLEDPKATNAAAVVKQAKADFADSFNPAATPRTPLAESNAAPADPAAPTPAPAANTALSLQDVPSATAGSTASAPAVNTNVPQSSPSSGTGVGIEIVHSSADSPAPTSTAFPGTATDPAKQADVNGGIAPVGPPVVAPLAPIEKPAVAPAPINDAATTKQPAAQLPPDNGKKPKVDCDKSDESCSRHKKKKGLGKLNPF
jgi:outer membrane protein assembly factor BamD